MRFNTPEKKTGGASTEQKTHMCSNTPEDIYVLKHIGRRGCVHIYQNTFVLKQVRDHICAYTCVTEHRQQKCA